jgi:hypothetical protein
MYMSLTIYLETQTCTACGRNDRVFRANVTHNCTPMAIAAGIGGALWRPDMNGIETARQLGDAIRSGVADLMKRPEHYRPLESPNGWGTYDGFVTFCQSVLAACDESPDARVEVCR